MIAYHGTDDVEDVIREGLLRRKATSLGCPFGHICIAETPELAARYGEAVLELDLQGMDGVSEFVGLEARVHSDIPPERIRLYPHPVVSSDEGHIDPGLTAEGHHPSCVALRRGATCGECGRLPKPGDTRWRAYLGSDDVAVVFCPECSDREFGAKP